MNVVKENKLELLYEGSVKKVFHCPQKNNLLFEFTDDYSIFDWGKMPDQIQNKGKALLAFGAYFFEELAKQSIWTNLFIDPALQKIDPTFLNVLSNSSVYTALLQEGLKSHFIDLRDRNIDEMKIESIADSTEEIYMHVQKADVFKPEPTTCLGHNLFYYPLSEQIASRAKLIPLEVVFRFGMPAGSSLKERIEKNPEYASYLGLNETPKSKSWFARPVLEFYTKLEAKDRLLSYQEAFIMSGLKTDQFSYLVDLAFLISLALYVNFANLEIELWDGKFEFILSNEQILLADSIGPDELRLIYKGCHFSKEMIRQVYRASDWEKNIKVAQKLAKERASLDWKRICQNDLGSNPASFPEKSRDVINLLYPSLTNAVCRKELFANALSLPNFVSAASEAGLLSEDKY